MPAGPTAVHVELASELEAARLKIWKLTVLWSSGNSARPVDETGFWNVSE